MGGPLIGGTIGGDHHAEVDTKVTGMVRAAVDGYLVPKFSMGAYFLYTSLPGKDISGSMGVLGFGMVLKGVFGNPRIFQFRAGGALGYQRNLVGFHGLDQSANGMGPSMFIEGAFPFGGTGLMGVIHASFISQPVGGNSDYDVHFPPMPYFGFGIEYGQ